MTNRPPAIEMKTAQIVRAQHPNRPSIIICGKCLKSGHQTKSCWGIIKCRRCSKDGHISFNCPSPPENKGFSPTILPSDNFQRIWKVPNPEKAGQIKTPKNKNQNNEDKTKKKPKRNLVVRPGVDAATVMAMVVILDRICCKPYTPMVCSSQ
ncbi:hypothetical protein EJB05_29783, partial [Eragrostis curvula]